MAEMATLVARRLIDTPGVWYRVETGTVDRRHTMGQYAWRIRNDRFSPFQRALAESGKYGRWESTVRTIKETGQVETYVRFVPEDAAGAA